LLNYNHKDLDECIQDIPRKDILMLIGDCNAKVGFINDGCEVTESVVMANAMTEERPS